MTAIERALLPTKATCITPARRLVGEVRVPGDKSISHRAAIIASLARDTSVLKNFSTAEDCDATVACLRALGVKVNRSDSTLTIEGAPGILKQPQQVLDAHNSGTTMRLLAGLLAGQPFESEITGDASLLSRPMTRVAEPLRLMGAKCETLATGKGPLRIRGRRPLTAIEYRPDAASAQIKSAILLAGLFADSKTTVIEPTATRDHTERLLSEFGAEISGEGKSVSVKGGSHLTAREFAIPGDVSSAAFFIGAAVALNESTLTICDVGLNPTRTAFLPVLRQMGADINIRTERIKGGEPIGTIHVRRRNFAQAPVLVLSGEVIPHVIDELPLLAVIAATRQCTLEVRDAAELRFKESDRIAATVQNLRAMGATVDEHDDGFTVRGRAHLRGAQLHSFDDHRIAMAFTVAALSADGPSEIVGAECVAVSFPQFYELLESVIEE